MNTEILKYIELVKHLEGSKGRSYNKILLKEARNKLNEIALKEMENQMELVIGPYILQKWFDQPRNRDRVMIFTKESWDKKESFYQEKFRI